MNRATEFCQPLHSTFDKIEALASRSCQSHLLQQVSRASRRGPCQTAATTTLQTLGSSSSSSNCALPLRLQHVVSHKSGEASTAFSATESP